MVAQKCSKNRTSNYHLFDMQRGGFGTVSRLVGSGDPGVSTQTLLYQQSSATLPAFQNIPDDPPPPPAATITQEGIQSPEFVCLPAINCFFVPVLV